MAFFVGNTFSNTVEVTDREAVEDLVDDLKAANRVHFKTYWDDDQLTIGEDGGTIHVENGYIDDFLSRLGALIEEPLVIRSVGFTKRDLPAAYQWIVYPGGTWEREALTDPKDVTEAPPPLSIEVEDADVDELRATFGDLESAAADLDEMIYRRLVEDLGVDVGEITVEIDGAGSQEA